MLELKHIAKTYKTAKGVKTEALKDINLRFPQRGMVFVLGKSGSGKSTLLNIIGGLDQADAGEIIINGKSSADFKQSDYDSYRNTYVGFIFQEFNLMEEYTIEKNIAMALQLQQKEASHADIEEMLKRLGLSGYAAIVLVIWFYLINFFKWRCPNCHKTLPLLGPVLECRVCKHKFIDDKGNQVW